MDVPHHLHHLQYIISKDSLDSKNLEKFLYKRDKAEKQYWIPVIFGPSVSTALKTSTILSN